MFLLATSLLTYATELPPSEASVHIFDSGLTLVLEEQKRTDQVAILISVASGARHEPANLRGVAHVVEHLMFEGSAHVPRHGFDALLQQAGGWSDAWTTVDQTAYLTVVPSGALELALFLESDRLIYGLHDLDDPLMGAALQVVAQERAESIAKPHGRDRDALTSLLFPQPHPYWAPVIGHHEQVQALSATQARAFFRQRTHPSNVVIGIVGNVDRSSALTRVEHWFSDFQTPSPSKADPRPTTQAPVHADGLLHAEVEDWTLYLAWPTPGSTHPDALVLDLLSRVLSDGRGTRLDDALVFRRRLANDADARHFNRDLGGFFAVSARTSSPRINKLERALEHTLQSVVTRPISTSELERARQSWLGEQMDRLAEPTDRAQLLVSCQRTWGRPDCLADQWERLLKVTPQDLARVVQTHLINAQRVSLSVLPVEGSGALPDAIEVSLP